MYLLWQGQTNPVESAVPVRLCICLFYSVRGDWNVANPCVFWAHWRSNTGAGEREVTAQW